MSADDGRQFAVWDTSAINALANKKDPHAVIARMSNVYVNCIPRYILDEIAATDKSERRDHLLDVCVTLKQHGGRVVASPLCLLQVGVHVISEMGAIDLQALLELDPDWEGALVSRHIFDDALATIQRRQQESNSSLFEVYASQSRAIPSILEMFESACYRPEPLNHLLDLAKTSGMLANNTRYYCEAILGHEIDSDLVATVQETFPPLTAFIYAFLFAHYHRAKHEPDSKPANAVDLSASAYLPICETYFSEDRNQQIVLRDVVRACSLQTEVIWFNGYKRFH